MFLVTFFDPMYLIIMLFMLVLGFRDLATVVTNDLTDLEVNLPEMCPQFVEALVSAVALDTDTLVVWCGPHMDHDLLDGAVREITLSTIENFVCC